MISILKKSILLSLFLLGICTTTEAQKQLLSKSTKQWTIHWGVTGGVGASHFFNNAAPDNLQNMPEGMDTYTMLYAPRPEGRLGLFMELEPGTKGIVSLYSSVNYMMRAVPKPTFHSALSSTVNNPYSSLFMNGVYIDWLLFIKPSDKLKIGFGPDFAQFLMTKQMKEGIYSEFAEQFNSYRGLKAVVAYSVNPRMDLQMHVSVGNTNMDKLQIDNMSIGTTVAYKLRGRAYKIEKEVYKVDYTK